MLMAMLLRTTSFTCSILVGSPVDSVFQTIAEPTNMVGLQPYLVRCDVLQKQVSADLRTRTYEVDFVERFQLLGPLRYDNKIRVRIAVQADPPQVDFHVRSVPRVQLHSRYHFEEDPAGARVRQDVTISCPAPLSSFVTRTARGAQEKLLLELKRKLEAPR